MQSLHRYSMLVSLLHPQPGKSILLACLCHYCTRRLESLHCQHVCITTAPIAGKVYIASMFVSLLHPQPGKHVCITTAPVAGKVYIATMFVSLLHPQPGRSTLLTCLYHYYTRSRESLHCQHVCITTAPVAWKVYIASMLVSLLHHPQAGKSTLLACFY